MKILLIAGVVPFRTDGKPGVTAAHVVTHALASALHTLGHEVVVQMLLHQSRVPGDLTPEEQAEIDALQAAGVRVAQPVYLSQFHRRESIRFRSLRLFFSTKAAEAHFYPGTAASPAILASVAEHAPDVIMPLWCPQGVAAVAGLTGVPVVAYHGDVDYLPMRCRLVTDRSLFFGADMSILARVDQLLRLAAFRRAHHSVMNRVECIANVTACNADFYAEKGHSHSTYVPNTWIERSPPSSSEHEKGTFKIIGHVGQLNRTGGTYGLRFLLKDLMPHLRRELQGMPFEVHIIGGGNVFPGIESYRNQPNVLWRGFVEDLDAELQSADAFCLFNNAGPYIAAYTRHLVAWEARQCLVVHANSRKAIPELRNGVNALCHDDPHELARMIRQLATDASFRQVIREGGRKAYEEGFRPAIVAARLADLLREVVSKKA